MSVRGRWRRKRVGVLLGGMSAEQEISQLTGEAVARSLSERGYNVSVIRAGADLPARLAATRVDVVFNALHGRFGEDGCVQGLLELMRIPYTGSAVTPSAIGMDKIRTKQIWEHAKLPTPEWVGLPSARSSRKPIHLPFRLPVVVKPACEGSSLGVTIVHDRTKLSRAISAARKLGGPILIERFVPGREVTVGLLAGKALTTMEVVPDGEFASYDVKYTPGREAFEIPAPLPAAIQKTLEKLAVDAADAIGVTSYARVDFRVEDDATPYLMEVNTLPGLHALSWFARMAAHVDIAYADLVERILDDAALHLEEVTLE